MGFCIRSEERSGNASKFTDLWLVGRKEVGASASLRFFGAERPKKGNGCDPITSLSQNAMLR